MANINASAIQAAIRDALLGGHGSQRTIASGTYKGALYEGLPDNERARRGLSKPRVEPVVSVTGRHEGSPSIIGSFQLLSIDVAVTIVRSLEPKHKLDDDTRDALYASANLDADKVFQALTYLENLSQDAEGNSTGLVSGLLRYEGSASPEVFADENEPGRIETTHNFSGIVKVNT